MELKMKQSQHISNRQSGAVSIFIVIFAALLLTVITVGFVRLMLADQQRATNNDLSQSAYDSALTGVEDAKRALLRFQNICQTGGPVACATARTEITDPILKRCNVGIYAGTIIDSTKDEGESVGGDKTGEILIQQNVGDDNLEQAYTCVKMSLDTPDYLGQIGEDGSKIVPLISASPFNEVTIQWFSSKDIGDGTAVDVPNAIGPAGRTLPDPTMWPETRPPLLRVGLMQIGRSFSLSDFDSVKAGGQSNANTLFLYPTTASNPPGGIEFVGRDPREELENVIPTSDSNATTPTECEPTVTADAATYSCSIKLKLPDPVDPGTRTAYLRLTSLYNPAHFRITLSDSSTPRMFSDVQAEVDSTGRANDLFRRVVSRVDMIDTNFAFPDAALDVSGSLCKDFAVTDEAAGYYPGAACSP